MSASTTKPGALAPLAKRVSVERAPAGTPCSICGKRGSVWNTPEGFSHLRCEGPLSSVLAVARGINGAMGDDPDARLWVERLQSAARGIRALLAARAALSATQPENGK